MSADKRETPLLGRHVAAGAKLADFASWQMPIEYPAGLRREHMAVREGCGIFDVSHMGRVETSGPGALELLQRLISNDIDAMPVGGAQYGLLCREDGGVLDDLFTYRLARDRFLTVTNAANHERDLQRFRDYAPTSGVEIEDRTDQLAMLAVQGPKAREICASLVTVPDGGVVGERAPESDPAEQLPPRMHTGRARLADVGMLICGTGYTGEDGLELICASRAVPAVWDRLVAAGAQPAGLGARDTLRLEACLHLYGNDLTVERNPIEAGLGWCCATKTSFIGAEAIEEVRRAGPAERLVAFQIEGPGIARQGNRLLDGGVVTSGTLSPCLGLGVGLAYVPAGAAALGTHLRIDVRGRVREAVIRPKPFVPKRA